VAGELSLLAERREHGKVALPADLVSALTISYAESPAIAAAAESIEASKEQLRNRKSGYQPRVDLRLRSEYGNDLDRVTGESTDSRAEIDGRQRSVAA